MLVRFPVRFTLLMAAMSLTFAALASASPAQVIRDFKADGHLDRAYSMGELRAAANESRGTAIEDGLNEAVENRFLVELAGFTPARRSSPPLASATSTRKATTTKNAKIRNEAERVVVPTPVRTANEVAPGAGLPGFTPNPVGSPAGGLPLAVTILGFLGGALMISGLASGVARRRLSRSR